MYQHGWGARAECRTGTDHVSREVTPIRCVQSLEESYVGEEAGGATVFYPVVIVYKCWTMVPISTRLEIRRRRDQYFACELTRDECARKRVGSPSSADNC